MEYLAPAMAYLAEHAGENASARAVELALLVNFLGSGTEQPVSIGQADLAAIAGASIPTISRVAAALQKSGRWEITAGTGRTETTYKPLFLEAITLAGEEAK